MALQLDLLFRVLVAGVCGAFIGYERRNRMKEAGIRTHLVVAIGASLMMVISKYGFLDQTDWSNLSLDPSRIAAQVVSGVGFLGAGMIFMQKQTVKGLTTAAGIWATAGIGMAVGAGLYGLGVGASLIILLAQIILHGRSSWLSTPKTEQVVIRFADEPGVIERLHSTLKSRQIAVLSFRESREDGEIELVLKLRLPAGAGLEQLLSVIQEDTGVNSVETA